jgi:hypothetical protein
VNGTITLAQVNAQVRGIQFLTFTDVISWSRKLNASLVNPSTIAVTFTTNKTHGLVNKLEIEGTANVTGRVKGKNAPAVGTVINATQVITVAQVSQHLCNKLIIWQQKEAVVLFCLVTASLML